MRDRAIGVVSSGCVLCLFTLAMVWGVLSSGMVGKRGKISNEYNTAEELMLLNCGVGEDSRESLGLQGDKTGQS